MIVTTGNNLFALTAAIFFFLFYSEGFVKKQAKKFKYFMLSCQFFIQTVSTEQFLYVMEEDTMQHFLS